jgi:hypothetical protein
LKNHFSERPITEQADVVGVLNEAFLLAAFGDFPVKVHEGTGGTKEPFKNIAMPFEFRKQVQEKIAVTQDETHLYRDAHRTGLFRLQI